MPLSCQSRDVAESTAFSSILPVSACEIPSPNRNSHTAPGEESTEMPTAQASQNPHHTTYEQNMWSGVMLVLGPTQFAGALVQQLGVFFIVQKRADMLVGGAGKSGGAAVTGNYRGG